MNTFKMLRSASMQSFDEYRLRESRSSLHTAVTDEGTLLDHSVLELRVNPPNVNIDNKSNDAETIITIDSANRPGTLVEVVQCLTEINLIVRSSQISSDGGWFIDVFNVEEPNGGKVLDPKKLNIIKKILKIDYECEKKITTPNLYIEDKPVYTVFELSGRDRVGLLHEITYLLARYGYDIKSLAAWTQGNWGALVAGAVLKTSNADDDHVKTQLIQLKNQLIPKMGERGVVKISEVTGQIHHERRLHQLLLKEAERSWNDAKNAHRIEEIETLIKQPNEFDAPEVKISYWPRLNYWRVNVRCRDRRKLLFDVVCTLADMNYDVYHGTVSSYLDKQIASQDFYIRPRFSDMTFKPDVARKLEYMLISSIRRRFPRGLKIHVLTLDKIGVVMQTANTFRQGHLWVSRAKVKSFTDENGMAMDHAVHTFYVVNEDKTDTCPDDVIALLKAAGGTYTTQLTEDRIPTRLNLSKDNYYFNVVQKDKYWDPKNVLMNHGSLKELLSDTFDGSP